MGTVVVLLGYQLSPLWLSQMLTVYFLITAISMGFAVVAFESVVSSAAFHRPFETRIMGGLAGIIGWVLALFLVVRMVDVMRLGALKLAFESNLQAMSFWTEMGLGVAAVALLLPKQGRSNPRNIFLGATAALLNGALYRLNCYLVGFEPGGGVGWTYFPSVGEIFVTLGVFSLHIVLYLVFVRYLPVLHAVGRH